MLSPTAAAATAAHDYNLNFIASTFKVGVLYQKSELDGNSNGSLRVEHL